MEISWNPGILLESVNRNRGQRGVQRLGERTPKVGSNSAESPKARRENNGSWFKLKHTTGAGEH